MKDSLFESFIKSSIEILFLVSVAVGLSELVVGESMSEHDAASDFAHEVVATDVELKVDHEKSDETQERVSQKPGIADRMASTVTCNGALFIVFEVDLDGKSVREGDSSRGTNCNEKDEEVHHESFWEFICKIGRTNLGVIEDDWPEKGARLSFSRNTKTDEENEV